MKSNITSHSKLPLSFSVLTASLGLLASTMANTTVLVDFGTSSSYRGASVALPDDNGNYWNETAGAGLVGMLDNAGWITGIGFDFTTGVATDSYNGPAGATTNSPLQAGELANTAFAPVPLANLGITNAVVDYVSSTNAGSTVRFTLSGLNSARTYNLTFFGSRKYPNGEVAGDNNTRTTVYSATDSNSVVIASTNLLVGVFGDHNSNTVATLAGLVPDAQNKIYVAFHGLTPTNAGYLNALQIEQVDPVPQVTADETILIDLGNDLSYNGASVFNPDANGFYWNSVWSGAFYANLIDVSNNATAVDFGFDSVVGTDNFNGPAGVVDAPALGLLGGAAEAVNDYYVSSSFQLQGLNSARTYKLTFFGSHKFNATNVTVYSVYTDNGYSNVVASASLNVGVNANHNSNAVAVISNLVPQAGNKLFVKFQGQGGVNGYLNALLVEGYNPPPSPPADETILVDFGSTNSFRGVSVVNPDENGNYWNSVWSGAYYANMLSKSGATTLVDLGFDSVKGADSFNGPAGAVINNPPTPAEIANTTFDAAALGDLGSTNAVMDYYVSSKFQIQGLRPTRTYRLSFLGSHKFNATNTTVYSVYTDSGYSNLVASANLVVGVGAAHNSNTVAVITNLTPQTANILYVKFEGEGGTNGYLNALKIEGYAGTSPYAQWVENYPTLGGSPYADEDGDGLSNIREYGSGGNPTNSLDVGYVPNYRVVSAGGSNQLEYVYARRTPATGLDYHLELNANLANSTGWTNSGYTEIGTGVLSAEFETVTNRVPMAKSQEFLRLVVQSQ